MGNVQKLEATILELQEALEKAQKELGCLKIAEWPQCGSTYHFVADEGVIVNVGWYGSYTDLIRKEFGNLFRTNEEAKHYRDWLKSDLHKKYYKEYKESNG